MKRHLFLSLISVTSLLGLTACQTVPPTETADINNDVCIGDPVVADPNKPIDLEEMAKQADCP